MRDDRICVADDDILVSDLEEMEVPPPDLANQFLEQAHTVNVRFLSPNDPLTICLGRREDLINPGAHLLALVEWLAGYSRTKDWLTEPLAVLT